MKIGLSNKIIIFWELLLTKFGLAWWIEVLTDNPSCVYYFGPFVNRQEAKSHLGGYLEDLQQENAQILVVDIKQDQPEILTACQENLW